MKRTLTVLCAALTFGVAGYAVAQSDQYGGGQSTSSQSSRSHSSKSSREVTLTGCLEQGADSNTYVLRNATEVNQSGSSSMGTSGSSSAGTSGSSSSSSGMSGENQSSSQESMSSGGAMDFQLVGKNLKKYVGQRVEVRGKVEPMNEGQGGSMSGTEGTTGGSTSGSTAGSTTGTSQSGSSSGTGQSGSMSGTQSGSMGTSSAITHRVKVNSVKQLGSSCQ